MGMHLTLPTTICSGGESQVHTHKGEYSLCRSGVCRTHYGRVPDTPFQVETSRADRGGP